MTIKRHKTDFPGVTPWLAAVAVMVMGLCGTAWGQSTTATTSSTESVVFNPPTTTTTSINLNSTQIIGRISGGNPLYNQTFAVPFSHPTAQAGVTAARAAITTAGGPGVIIGSPIRTASSSSTTTSSSTIYSLAATTRREEAAVITLGPGSTQIGQRTVCTGITTLPSSNTPTCSTGSPTTLNLAFGDTNININTATTYNINQATTTTNSTTLFEQYIITGVVRRIGSVHALSVEAGSDATSLFTQRLRTAGDGDLKRGF